MRTLSLVNCVEIKFSGSILKNALCFGDCDNDFRSEFIFGNSVGELFIYRDQKAICFATDLGTISAVAVGDLLNISRNILVVISIEGWCHIFDVETELSTVNRTPSSDSDSEPLIIYPFHSQRIPPNAKCLNLGDVNGDGLTEMVIALTDRVVRTYQWRVEDENKQHVEGISKEDLMFEVFDGRLFAVNKWELAGQVESIAFHRTRDVTSILVGQPGGTIQRITEAPLSLLLSETCANSSSTINSGLDNAGGSSTTSTLISSIKPARPSQNRIKEQSISSPVENISIDYFTFDVDRVLDQNLSTEVAGNVLSETESDDLYAVATLDGSIIIAKDNEIQWTFQLDQQICSLFQLRGRILACTWDGDTYLIEGRRSPVRFHFEESVAAFVPGLYSLGSSSSNLVLGGTSNPNRIGSTNLMCMAYATFNERIYIYPIPDTN